MAHIRYIFEDEATRELRELYDRYRAPAGHLDNILRIHGLNPPSLKAHWELYHTLVHEASAISRIQREMIAIVVSSINKCRY